MSANRVSHKHIDGNINNFIISLVAFFFIYLFSSRFIQNKKENTLAIIQCIQFNIILNKNVDAQTTESGEKRFCIFEIKKRSFSKKIINFSCKFLFSVYFLFIQFIVLVNILIFSVVLMCIKIRKNPGKKLNFDFLSVDRSLMN